MPLLTGRLVGMRRALKRWRNAHAARGRRASYTGEDRDDEANDWPDRVGEDRARGRCDGADRRTGGSGPGGRPGEGRRGCRDLAGGHPPPPLLSQRPTERTPRRRTTVRTPPLRPSRRAAGGDGGGQPAEPFDPNPGALTLSGGFDVLNQYMFRRIRQHSTGVARWPRADLGIALHSSDGGLTSVGVNIGTWNSLHTGDTGTDGPSTKLWDESDFSTTLAFGFSHGIAVGATYTAYTSPNNSFSTVKELSVKLAFDDSPQLGKASLKPYVLLAQEFDTAPGLGQADACSSPARISRLASRRATAGRRRRLPCGSKFEFSLSDYYESRRRRQRVRFREPRRAGDGAPRRHVEIRRLERPRRRRVPETRRHHEILQRRRRHAVHRVDWHRVQLLGAARSARIAPDCDHGERLG